VKHALEEMEKAAAAAGVPLPQDAWERAWATVARQVAWRLPEAVAGLKTARRVVPVHGRLRAAPGASAIDVALPPWYRAVVRERIHEAVCSAIRDVMTAVFGTFVCSGGAPRDAILATMGRQALVRRTRGGAPLVPVESERACDRTASATRSTMTKSEDRPHPPVVKCFVSMPFTSALDAVYRDGIFGIVPHLRA
jgi:hypothetical protein